MARNNITAQNGSLLNHSVYSRDVKADRNGSNVTAKLLFNLPFPGRFRAQRQTKLYSEGEEYQEHV